MDQELFDLCKEVYKRTGWYGDMFGWFYTDLFSKNEYKRMRGRNGSSIPEYTSDYLLEKLPWSTVCSGPNMGMFGAWMNGKTKETFNEADTPLKALLRLVIALHEAGDVS